ncbi:zinc finger protein 271-like isoform X2 [Lutzomyia longipalpis]|uniref:zinc finger protein 271-like isoform X2 n=1 Tax=Lutzomyia longipalpis TaxID=7200 RepID=UPI002483F3F8|nr:zinc finger protein 271-like isoform X2 [Lutzomyia longipalpis]
MDVVGGVVPEYNLDKLCRLCLKEDEDVRSIFSDENGQTFTEIIMACAEIQIQENDGMPNQMCGMCKVQVQSAYAFRKRTEENDASLRMYMVHKFPERFKASEIHQNALETNSILDLKPDQEFQNVEFTLSIEPDVSFGVDMDDGVAGEEVIEYLETDEDLKPQFDKESEEKSQEEGSTVMVCHVCNEEYADVGELKGHIESTHTRHKVKQCRACRTQFRMKTQAKRLTTEQEEQVEEESKADKEACSQCEKKFPNVEALKAHLQTHKKQKRGRPSLKDIEVRNQLSNLKDEEEKQNKVYQMIQEYSPEGVVALCRICDVTFSKICQLRNHLNKHKCLDSFADVNLTTKCYLFDNTKIMPDMETNESLINYVMNEICMGNSTRFYQITNNNGHEFELSDSDSSESGTEDFLSGDRRHHQCSACQQVFDRLYKILAHMRLDHIESDFTAKCPQCTRVFPNDALLAKHTRLQCQNKEKMYFCRICKIKFMWENSHEKHHQNFHANRTLVAKGRRDKIAKGKPREKSFPCSICSKAFYRQEHLDRHVKIHMPSEKKFECTVCQKKFNRKDNLRSHMRVHKDIKEDTDKHLCVYCGRSFSNSSNLIVHMRRHTGEKPYRCDLCDKGFPRSSDLQCHRRTHTGEKPCLCTICGKGFSRSNKLVRHMRIHTGVRPYKCTYCDRAFTQSNDLTLHIRRHTGDKPYVCGICGDRFIQGTALAAHRRMQGHYEEVNQPTPFSSISVNNPNRFTNANRVNRIGIPPATQPEQQQQQQPQPTTLIISPSTQVTTLANIKTEKVQNEAIVIPVNALTQSTQNRASSPLNPTIARIHVNSAGYGANGQIFSSFEVTSLLSMPHYQMQQQTTDTQQQQQQQPNQQGYN